MYNVRQAGRQKKFGNNEKELRAILQCLSTVQLPDRQTFLTNANIVQEQSHQTEQSLMSGKCTRTLQHKEPLVEKTRQMARLGRAVGENQ